MFVKVKDFYNDFDVIINVDRIVFIKESPVCDDCRDIIFDNGVGTQVKDGIDDLMALLEEAK